VSISRNAGRSLLTTGIALLRRRTPQGGQRRCIYDTVDEPISRVLVMRIAQCPDVPSHLAALWYR
jgi:hypothetical protein